MATIQALPIQKAINAATTNITSDTYIYQRHNDEHGLAQVEITGSGNVSIQGRLSADSPWVAIKEYTASGADVIAIFPQMRVVLSSVSGTVNVWIAE